MFGHIVTSKKLYINLPHHGMIDTTDVYKNLVNIKIYMGSVVLQLCISERTLIEMFDAILGQSKLAVSLQEILH